MFNLVADIGRYPDFLPWCRQATVTSKNGNVVTADLVVGTRLLCDRFSSRVTLREHDSISVAYLGGPLERLSNEWRFEPKGQYSCELSFYLDFAFRSPLLGSMMSVFFDKAFRTMAQAFEARAKELYGEPL